MSVKQTDVLFPTLSKSLLIFYCIIPYGLGRTKCFLSAADFHIIFICRRGSSDELFDLYDTAAIACKFENTPRCMAGWWPVLIEAFLKLPFFFPASASNFSRYSWYVTGYFLLEFGRYPSILFLVPPSQKCSGF